MLAGHGAYAVDAADISESDHARSKVDSTATTLIFRRGQSFLRGEHFRPVELMPADQPLSQRRRLEHQHRAQGSGISFQPESANWICVLRGRVVRRAHRDNLTAFAVVPATYRLSETMRININAGWLWDRTVDRIT